jgi:hypothetical protein
MKLEFSCDIFQKYLNVQFHENPSNGSRVLPHGHMDGPMGAELFATLAYGWTGRPVKKLIFAFHNVANAQKPT